MVHPRVRAQVQCFPQQVEILQGRPQRHRPAGHSALLRVPVPGRDEQKRQRPVPGRAPRDTDLPYHAHTAHSEAGPTFHRAAEPGLHAAQLVQGVGPAHALPSHGRADLLQPGVLCRKRGARHQVRLHTGDVLVGGHYDDDRRLRRHLSDDNAGQGDRRRLLHLRRTGDRPTNSYHCE